MQKNMQIDNAASNSETPASVNNAPVQAQAPVQSESAAPAEQASGILANNDAANDNKEIQGDFPADWQNKMAGGDEKTLKAIAKYGSPKAVAEALVAAQRKISTYKAPAELPENPTEADIAKYRKENGIPDTPKGYDIKLDNGIVIGEHDMPIVEKVLEKAHEHNVKPKDAKVLMQAYFEHQQAEYERMNAELTNKQIEINENFRQEWGQDYRSNVNFINTFVNDFFGAEDAKSILQATTPEGLPLSSNPTFINKMLELANERSPRAVIAGEVASGATIDSRMKEIENIMKTNRDKYFADGLNTEYAQLVAAKEKLAARSR